MRPFLRPVQALLHAFHDATACTMVATPSLKYELKGNGYRRLALWPLGVDANIFVRNPSPEVPRLPKPIFVFFSRLAPETKPEAFLKLDLPGTKLVIGDGPERQRLEAGFRGQATFVGFKHGQELADWLSSCDAMVFPSRTETFGLVILEALACGIPVAAHDVMGPRDIIDDGVDGILREDLKEAALACLALDRGKCREKALRYSWDASAAAFKKNLVRASGARAEASDSSVARLRAEIAF
jgi:glycosyltransferase involved in cell wall biosynthesis